MNTQLNNAREFLNANPALHARLKSGAFVVCQKVKAKPVFICIDEEQVLISESDVSLELIKGSLS